MTNAEKYLKDHIIFTEFANNLAEYIVNSGRKITDKHDIKTETLYFLIEETKPKLTEDERVILRNIDKDNYDRIGREDDMLYLKSTDQPCCYGYKEKELFWYMYHDLFQFIKNGEEYSIEELLGENNDKC